MGNLFTKARDFVLSASYTRTLTILSILVILAAIPLTVYIAQREQDIRQRASGDQEACNSQCQSQDATCRNLCQRVWENDYRNADQEYNNCVALCDPGQITECTSSCQATKDAAYTAADSKLNSTCLPECNSSYASCRQACEPFNCSGVQNLDGGDPEEYQCQLSEGSSGYGCQSGWTQSQQLPNTCTGEGKYCCWRPAGGGSQPTQPPGGGNPGGGGGTNTEGAGNSAPGGNCRTDYAEGGKFWHCQLNQGPCGSDAGVGVPYICNGDGSWNNANPSGECSTLCRVSGSTPPQQPTATPGTPPVGGGNPGLTCQDNQSVSTNPPAPAGYSWKAKCGVSCTVVANPPECPKNTWDPSNVNPNSSTWCYGFSGGPKCLQLVRDACQTGQEAACRAATPTPTTRPGEPAACDPTQLNMSAFPTNPAVGASITFNTSGTQGSTHVGDTWSGGVDCSGGFAGNKTCNVTASGTFTWTHTWRNCAGSLSNCSSTVCSKSLSFSVGGGTGTTPTASISPTGSGTTPTGASPTGSTSPTATPTAGGAQFNVTLNLSAISAGKSIRTPTRTFQVELFDATGQQIDSARIQQNPTVTYNSSTGKFTGSVYVNPINSGNYTMKIRTGSYLKKLVAGFLTVPNNATQNAVVAVPETTLIVGDSNNDNKVDIQDYNNLIACFGNKKSTDACGPRGPLVDFDDNNDVDEVDFNIFVRSLAIQTGD